MNPRTINECVQWVGAIDWNRRLFDALIPLPDGTSYNAYLVQGSKKTALIDAVDPTMAAILCARLAAVPRIDYVISQHAEQDHSGAIAAVLARYPQAKLRCTPKAQELLVTHLHLPPEKIAPVDDGETLSLGNKTLHFIHTPWVHWPETMCTYLPEDKILFSGDFFGSHLAMADLYAGDDPRVACAAKRYYAEIIMPVRNVIRANLEKLAPLDVRCIAPTHGPLHDHPARILDAYREWVSDAVASRVVLPYTTMHGSTERMVDCLVELLIARDIPVEKFELSVTDLGALAMALVDAATIVLGTPTIHFGAHPLVHSATHLVNTLRPKLKYAAIIGSYGWGTQAAEQLSALIANLKVEMLGTHLCKGLPRTADLDALTGLADTIREKHALIPHAV